MPVQLKQRHLNSAEARRDARLAQIGVIGVVALALASFLILNLNIVSRFWAAAPYEADFSHASGLKNDDPVQISGSVAPEWQTFSDPGGDHAFAAELGEETVLVYGSAPEDELRALVASLTTETLKP